MLERSGQWQLVGLDGVRESGRLRNNVRSGCQVITENSWMSRRNWIMDNRRKFLLITRNGKSIHLVRFTGLTLWKKDPSRPSTSTSTLPIRPVTSRSSLTCTQTPEWTLSWILSSSLLSSLRNYWNETASVDFALWTLISSLWINYFCYYHR